GARGVRDAVLELPVHLARIAAAPLLAVHAHDHLQAIGIAELVGGDEARPHGIGVVEILALARSELPRHLLGLLVARGEVVEDGVAEDVLARTLPRDVLAGPADIAAELELEIEALAVRWPGYVGARAADREAVGMVEDGALVPDLWDACRGPPQLRHRLESLHQMLLEAEEVAHLRRIRDGGEQQDALQRQDGGRVFE